MQLISTNFVILWVIFFALYYLVPAKRQWMILAVASGLFYVAGTGGIPVGIVLTGAGAYGCGIYLARSLEAQKLALSDIAEKERKKAVKQGFERRRRRVQILYFVYSLGILLCTKYMVVILPFLQKTGLTTPEGDAFFARVVMPLGISFYTLTAIGYVVDDEIAFDLGRPAPNDKGTFCAENGVEVMIDDLPEYLLGMEGKTRVMIFDQPYNRDLVIAGAERVYSWYDIYGKIQEVR